MDYIHRKAQSFLPEIHIQAAVTRDTRGEDLTEILDMHYQSGVSIFGDGTETLANSDRLMKILQYLQRFNGVLFDHSYDPLLALFGKMHEGEISTHLGMKGIPNLAEDLGCSSESRNFAICRREDSFSNN